MATLEQVLRPNGYDIPPYRETEMKLVLSLTGDILAFRRCARQYGLQSVRGFALAHATQEFVGTFAHRSMARAFRYYREKGRAPTNLEVATILSDVRELLREQKRRPHSWDVVQKVGCRVMRLNRSFDTYGVYERMVDTERGLQTDDEEFVIQGRVDVIQRGSEIELWDYKATQDPRRMPVAGRRGRGAEIDRAAAQARLADYTLQLLLYAHLHREVYQEAPTACRLVFINEIKVDDEAADWAQYNARPVGADAWKPDDSASDQPGLFFSVSVGEDQVLTALSGFRETGRAILAARRRDAWPAPDEARLPDTATCDACDLRYSCGPACAVHRYDQHIA
jgi:hypothetical protein